MTWKSIAINYEEVSGYSPVSPLKQSVFLKPIERANIWKVKKVAVMYLAYKLSLLFILALTIMFHTNVFLISGLVFLSPLFISIVDHELYKLSTRILAFEQQDSPLRHLGLPEANGWYDDPWANGILNQQRMWEDGKWSKETRIKP